ncbi:MAG: hypothetical protein HY922_00420, partial [Elusimicrobia bacterium]|nr:hypothetical protein [Elusimicrobiota bacterium]
GSVGIGVTNPQSKVDVEGGMAVGATYSGASAAPANGMIVEGSVGIGLTSPGYKLDVSGGDINTTYNLRASLALYAQSATLSLAGNAITLSGAGANINFSGAGLGQIITAGGQNLALMPGGSVGIGVATPQNKLDVEGSMAVGAAYSGLNAAPTNGLIVEGGVGIGLITPGAKLDVAGNVKLGTAGTAFTAAGACTIAAAAISATANVYTCTGVPASTAVAVWCSGSAAMTTPNTTALYCRPNGTVNTIVCNTTAVNAIVMNWTCMWMQP